MEEDPKRLGDDRAEIGRDFERSQTPEESGLGRAFVEQQSARIDTVGDQFAHPEIIERRRLGDNFADPNSMDDAKLGAAFEEANSHPRKRDKERKATKPRGSQRILYWVIAGAVVLLLFIFLIGFLPRHKRDNQNARMAEEQRNPRSCGRSATGSAESVSR